MKSFLYTLIVDFKKNTYVTQSNALNPKDAIKNWCSSFDFDTMDVSKKKRNTFISSIVEGEPTQISNCKNVWCIISILDEKLVIINIVKTSMPDFNIAKHNYTTQIFG